MTNRQFSHINQVWGFLIVEELIRNGIDYFCIAPGSRSAPLTVAVAEHPKAKSFIHYDERGLAFHALGYVAATRKPCVLICTSGSAVANFLPAVIEASKKKLPLIILTADRPPELRNTGADQTIEQVGIFGPYVRWQCDMPCPDPAIAAEYVLTTIDQAMYRSLGELKGPVHVNCMYREPLAPGIAGEDWCVYLETINRWRTSNSPFTTYINAKGVGSVPQYRSVAEALNRVQRGIIAVGKLNGEHEEEALLALAQRLNWPIFPDVTSGLRLKANSRHTVHFYDQLLLAGALDSVYPFDGVIQIGGRMTSKRFAQCLARTQLQEYIMVLNHPLRNDPGHQVTVRCESGLPDFCRGVLPLIKSRAETSELKNLVTLSRQAERWFDRTLSRESTLTEPAVAYHISRHISNRTTLFLANSMPIRDMDMFGCVREKSVTVVANRGASGIDGLIASAHGFAQGTQVPLTMVIGDLAFLHDLNSLNMVAKSRVPMCVVVINNDGGGIFSFLPIGQWNSPAKFESHFGTPHGLRFKQAAGLFGINYASTSTSSEFAKMYQDFSKKKQSIIIEVRTDRVMNYQQHQTLQSNFKEWISKGAKAL